MKRKLYRLTTISCSFNELLRGQLRYLNNYFDVSAIAHDTGTLAEVATEQGVNTIAVTMARDIKPWQDLKSLARLYRLFRRGRPDIVHANTPKASLLAMVAAFAARVPHRIYTVTGLRFETTTGLKRLLLKSMERLTCACATKVIPEGEGVRATLLREGITRKSLHKIHNGNINGVDLDHFRCSEEVLLEADRLKTEEFIFIFVGRIVRDKGIDELVEAFDRLSAHRSDVALHLVGRFEEELDPISPRTRQTIEHNARIRLCGYQRDVRPYIAAADILVLPSYREGFPNVVIQAGAMETPAIVSDISGCNEIIIDGQNGIIVPPRDAEALYRAMVRVVEHRTLTRQMAQRARAMVASRYDQRDVWRATLEMYRNL